MLCCVSYVIRRTWFLVSFLTAALISSAAGATCVPLAQAPSFQPRVIPAAFRQTASVPENHLRITFVGHASFLIESPGGVKVLTDFNGFIVPDVLPDIVTMNNSHQTHYTDYVDSRIKNVLRGWDPAGGLVRHNMFLKDVRVRSVPTNVSEFGGRQTNGNSMFVIESTELCVVHMGHLHHLLSEQQIGELGQVDILFVPIDGYSTMTHSELFKVLAQLKPRLIIPMHYHQFGSAEAFVAQAKPLYPIRTHSGPTIDISLAKIPRPTHVLFLQGQ